MADIILGTDTATGKFITLTMDQFEQGGYILGIRGAGKSHLLQQMIMQSILYPRGVCVIDPHQTEDHTGLIDSIIRRIPKDRLQDVILLEPYDSCPFGLNIYHCPDKRDDKMVEYTVDRVENLFKKLWPSENSQPLVEDVIRSTAYIIIENDATMTEISPLLYNDAYRKRCANTIHNEEIKWFWDSYENPKSQEREIGAGVVGRRIRKFTANPIVRNLVAHHTLNFRDILDETGADGRHPKIVLVRLHSEMESLTTLLGSIIVGQLLQAAYTRKKDIGFHLYCDEFSNFATRDFSKIISECRKYGLIPFISHQSRGQISEENQDNAMQLGNLVVFRVIGKDGYDVAAEFDVTPPIAKKPKPAIAGNVLEHFHRHKYPQVRKFWNKYVRRWEEAAKQQVRERRVREGGRIGDDGLPLPTHVTIYPEMDLGLGTIQSYDPDLVKEALIQLNELLYEVQVQNKVPQSMRKRLLNAVSEFFGKYSFSLFANDLDDVIAVLLKEDGKIPVPNTEWIETLITQQTYHDKLSEIGNELRGLKSGTARIRTATGEYVIKTLRHDPMDAELKKMSQYKTADIKFKKYEEQYRAILEHTRKDYCRTREEVEQLIRQRQQSSNEPTTKRRGI